MAEPAIEVRDLRKTFPAKRRNLLEVLRRVPRREPRSALEAVDLEVRRGELFGLLGPNGAGKTTLVKILATLLLPTEGEARVLGLDVREHESEIRRRVGVVLGGDRGLYWRLTARENLWYFSQLYDIPSAKARESIERVLAAVDLVPRADDRVENYSKGMKQRLHVARGLLTDPEVLLLDEPTLGLDPHAARDLRALVRRLVDEDGRTVVLTTHYLYEADELSDRIGILDKGRIIALDTAAHLKARHAAGGSLRVRVRHPPEGLDKRLGALAGVRGVAASRAGADGVVEYTLAGALEDDAPGRVVAELQAAGAHLVGLRVEEPSLEDVFVALTGAGLEEPGEEAP